jgi:hypothetical protein
MPALYQISTNTVINDYGDSLPIFIHIPNVCDVHNPGATWTFGDYELLPTIRVGSPPNVFSQVNTITYAVSTVNNQLSYVITTTYYNPPLANVQSGLCDRIDSQAENLRIKYLTPGAGLATVFIMRHNEALAIQNDASPNNTTYPIHAAIVAAGAANLTAAATLSMNAYITWANTAGAIEQIRLTTKNNINAANTILGAAQAYANVNWGSL